MKYSDRQAFEQTLFLNTERFLRGEIFRRSEDVERNSEIPQQCKQILELRNSNGWLGDPILVYRQRNLDDEYFLFR